MNRTDLLADHDRGGLLLISWLNISLLDRELLARKRGCLMKTGIVDLRSDTQTLPTQEMIQAMAKAQLGDDVCREDPTVRQLEELACYGGWEGSSSVCSQWNHGQSHCYESPHQPRRRDHPRTG
jgi:hypothetical protein